MKRILTLVALLAAALPAVAAEATGYEDLQVFDTIVCDVVIVKDYVRGNSNFFRIADDADGDVTFTVASGLTITSVDTSTVNFGVSAILAPSGEITGDFEVGDSLYVAGNAVVVGTFAAEGVVCDTLGALVTILCNGNVEVGDSLIVSGDGLFSATVDVVDGLTAGTLEADNGVDSVYVVAADDTLEFVGGVLVDIR